MVTFVLILNLVKSLRLIFYIRPFNQKKTMKQGRKQGCIEGLKSGELDPLVQNISLLLESGTISDIQQAFSILRVQKEMQSKDLKRLNLH